MTASISILTMSLLAVIGAWSVYRDFVSRAAARNLVPIRSHRRRSLHTGRRPPRR